MAVLGDAKQTFKVARHVSQLFSFLLTISLHVLLSLPQDYVGAGMHRLHRGDCAVGVCRVGKEQQAKAVRHTHDNNVDRSFFLLKMLTLTLLAVRTKVKRFRPI